MGSLLLSRVALPRRYMGLRDSWGGFAPTAPACTYLQNSPAADQRHIQLAMTTVTGAILLRPEGRRKLSRGRPAAWRALAAEPLQRGEQALDVGGRLRRSCRRPDGQHGIEIQAVPHVEHRL